jgi:hypothetical protein
MSFEAPGADHAGQNETDGAMDRERPKWPACPLCGGPLVEVKQKLQCANCRAICETCCEGGRG